MKIPETIVTDVQKYFDEKTAKQSPEFWHNMKSEPLSPKFWDKLMINGVAIPGVMLKFDDLYESLKPFGLQGFLTQPFDLSIFGQTTCVTRQKCAGKNIRRHNRKCQKRGACHKTREGLARRTETMCRDYGLDVHVRRGRHGKGQSLHKAEEMVIRAVGRLYRPVDPLRAAIVATYGPDVKIDTSESGTVSITTDVEADPKYVIAAEPLGVRVVVNGVEI